MRSATRVELEDGRVLVVHRHQLFVRPSVRHAPADVRAPDRRESRAARRSNAAASRCRASADPDLGFGLNRTTCATISASARGGPRGPVGPRGARGRGPDGRACPAAADRRPVPMAAAFGLGPRARVLLPVAAAFGLRTGGPVGAVLPDRGALRASDPVGRSGRSFHSRRPSGFGTRGPVGPVLPIAAPFGLRTRGPVRAGPSTHGGLRASAPRAGRAGPSSRGGLRASDPRASAPRAGPSNRGPFGLRTRGPGRPAFQASAPGLGLRGRHAASALGPSAQRRGPAPAARRPLLPLTAALGSRRGQDDRPVPWARRPLSPCSKRFLRRSTFRAFFASMYF